MRVSEIYIKAVTLLSKIEKCFKVIKLHHYSKAIDKAKNDLLFIERANLNAEKYEFQMKGSEKDKGLSFKHSLITADKALSWRRGDDLVSSVLYLQFSQCEM